MLSAVLQSGLTSTDLREDSLRCDLTNPEVLIETYGTVRHQKRGIIPFMLWPWQREWLRESTNADIICKSRDIGSSAIAVCRDVTRSIWEGGDILIAADVEKNAVNLLDIARTFLKGLPGDFQITFEEDNKTFLKVRPYGFSITALSRPMSQERSSAGRSERCLRLICTEMASWPWAESYFASVTGALVAGGTIVIESTPNGVGNLFAQQWFGATGGKNDYKPFMRDWRHNPEHDEAWEKEKTDKLSSAMFAQEHGCDFIQSGRAFFEESSLVLLAPRGAWNCKAAIPGCLGTVKEFCRTSELEVYQLPQAGHTYTGGADCATGTGADFDDLSIIDDETLCEVAALHGQWKCDVYGQKIDALARMYPGRYAIERPGPGEAVIQECRRLGTPGLWRSRHDGKFGWPTAASGPHARRPMLDMLERDLRLKEIKFGSQRFIDEARVFQFGSDDEPRAAGGYNDDAVMSRAIANKVRKSARPGVG